MKEPAINWQFRVCPLAWFSNFLEHCLRVKPGSISYSTSEGSESVLWFLRMAIQWYTHTLLLPVGSKFQKEGTNMSFEFIQICWFQFFNFFRIRESPDTVLWNKSESKSCQSSYFKPLREPMGVFMQKPAINWWVYSWLYDFFQKQIENRGHGAFDFWELWLLFLRILDDNNHSPW